MVRHRRGHGAPWKSGLFLGILLLCMSGASQAQYTHTLSNCMNNMQMNNATDLAVGRDGTIFLVNDGGGLWAYRHSDSKFIPQAFLPFRENLSEVKVGPDGVVYVAHEQGFLAALVYTGSSFREIARITDDITINDFAIGDDGSIFIAMGREGIAVYRRYRDRIFRTAQASNGGEFRAIAVGSDNVVYAASRYTSILSAYLFKGEVLTRIGYTTDGIIEAHDLAVRQDGTVFLADLESGLSAYHFDGVRLVRTAYINSGGAGTGVTATADGRVYLANAGDGLRVYYYTGSVFITDGYWRSEECDARSVAVMPDRTVFLANGPDGLRALLSDGLVFSCTGHCHQEDEACSVAVGTDGNIYLANGKDGLRAYRRSEPFLECMAFTNGDSDSDIDARAVATDAQNRVFLAHNSALSVYAFTGSSFALIAHADAVGPANGIAVDAAGRVYLACGFDGMQVFQFDGTSLRHLRQVYDGGRAMDVAVTDAGTVFLADGPDGTRAYLWRGEELMCVARVCESDGSYNWARKVALGPGHTVYVATSQVGLYAYRFNGRSFVSAGHLPFAVGGYFAGVSALSVGTDGTVFLGYSGYHSMDTDGVYACTYDGSGFTVTAHAEHADVASDLAVAPNGILYLADRYAGLIGYRYASLLGAPQLTTDTRALDFGKVNLLDIELRQVKFWNTGSAPLFIHAVKLTNFGREEFTLAFSLPSVLPPGESASLGILYHPMSEGQKEALVQIASNDPDEPDITITLKATAIHVPESPLPPHILRLRQNTPNPFNPSTNIEFFLPRQEHARLAVFDLVGRRVATLADGTMQAGWHTLRFDAASLASGIYVYRLEAGSQVQTRTMVLTK